MKEKAAKEKRTDLGRGILFGKALGITFMLALVFFFGNLYILHANSPEISFEKEEIVLYMGDSYKPKLLREEMENPIIYFTWETISETSGDPIRLDDKTGEIIALSPGAVIVTVHLQKQEGEKEYTNEMRVQVRESQKLAPHYGDAVRLEAASLELYQDSTFTASEENIVQVQEDGSITVIGYGNVNIFAQTTRETTVCVAEIQVIMPSFVQKELARALTSEPFQLQLQDAGGIENTTWEVSNPKVASIDQQGILRPLATGTVTVKANLYKEGIQEIVATCTVEITKPSLSANLAVAVEGKKSLSLRGLGKYSTVSWSISNSAKAAVTQGRETTVTGLKKGNIKLFATVDGVTLTCNLYITKPKFKTATVLLARKKKTTLQVSGLSTYSTVAFTSGNAKQLKVWKKTGKIKGLKNSCVQVTAVVDGKTITCDVVVGKWSAINAVKYARTQKGKKYSQAKRMKKNYYDCSSFIWRCYSRYKIDFGVPKEYGWAPVASAEAKWCKKHKKVIAKKAVKKKKLLPGDLIFYSYGGNNGQYKNIDHVAMYTSDGKIIHASSSKGKVVEVDYYPSDAIVMIARPSK